MCRLDLSGNGLSRPSKNMGQDIHGSSTEGQGNRSGILPTNPTLPIQHKNA